MKQRDEEKGLESDRLKTRRRFKRKNVEKVVGNWDFWRYISSFATAVLPGRG